MWHTARYGTLSLIFIGITILFGILGLPLAFLFGLTVPVLAIISLAKKETPKWSAIVSLALTGTWLLVFGIFAIFVLGGLIMVAFQWN